MVTENCGICGARAPLGSAIHVLIHTKSEEGVVDYYICQTCYEGKLKPLFDSDISESEER